jgi:regulator of RNase E activity RraA
MTSDPSELLRRFAGLSTSHLADACVVAGVPVRCGPAALRPIAPGTRLAGRVCPARHAGSVDIFLEAMSDAAPGDVLVADNGGRLDESCVGDLIALEAQAAGLHGMVVWGLHRDTAELGEIGLPVFSLGALAAGPSGLRPRAPDALDAATVGDLTVSRADLVFGDDDGVLFLPAARADEVLSAAETIRDTERGQASRIRDGITLRAQVQFDRYLADRRLAPGLTFREHLRTVGGAIEQ